MKLTLDDIRLLKSEAEVNNLRPDRVQVYKLKQHVEYQLAQYERMRNTINSVLFNNPESNESLFIGPFLAMATRTATEDLIEDENTSDS
jgi:hypothetical protein